jgi:hypothetical protein
MMSFMNKFCGYRDGILCPFAFKFTDGNHFVDNKNDMPLYGQYHEFYPTGISFGIIDHFVQLFTRTKIAEQADPNAVYLTHFDFENETLNLQK